MYSLNSLYYVPISIRIRKKIEENPTGIVADTMAVATVRVTMFCMVAIATLGGVFGQSLFAGIDHLEYGDSWAEKQRMKMMD